MLKKLKEKADLMGMVFTAASAVFVILLSAPFLTEPRLQAFMYDAGVDSVGALFSAALFFGCVRQKGEGNRAFKWLIVLVSACFAVNEAMLYTQGALGMSALCFALCLLSKLLDLAVVTFFYVYIRVTLRFEGRLAQLTEKIVPVLLGLEVLVVLSNLFFPATFYIDSAGKYQMTAAAGCEDVYLIVTMGLTAILVLRSRCPRSQKAAALTFLSLPLAEYVVMAGMFGNSAQYGMVLMSLLVMYCVIFDEKSRKLASTETELTLATQIQTGMLPSIFPAFPNRPEFDIHASMDPAKEVGGDFYDLFLIDEDHLAMVIADVSGKGIPAALFMMSAKILINDHALIGGTPAEILERVNRQVCLNNKAQMFVTVWLGILEISTGKLTTASAGHEYPMLNLNGRYELLKDRHGLAIGAMEEARYKNTEIQLKKGDSLFVYTDGVAEATDENEQLFGTDRTLEALNAMPAGVSQKEVLLAVRNAVDDFVKEAPQFDDLTMLGLTYFGRWEGLKRKKSPDISEEHIHKLSGASLLVGFIAPSRHSLNQFRRQVCAVWKADGPFADIVIV